MKNLLHIGVGPLTGTVFVGKILKTGIWAAGKQDVTGEFLNCIVQKFGPERDEQTATHKLNNFDGVALYEITVTRLPPAWSP